MASGGTRRRKSFSWAKHPRCPRKGTLDGAPGGAVGDADVDVGDFAGVVGHDLQDDTLLVADILGGAEGDLDAVVQGQARGGGISGRHRLHLVGKFRGKAVQDSQGVVHVAVGAVGAHLGREAEGHAGDVQANSRTPNVYGYYTSLKEVPQRSKGETFNGSWQAFAMNDYVLRYSDIMLMRAEALIELGRLAEARTIINDIRQRAKNSVDKHVEYAKDQYACYC